VLRSMNRGYTRAGYLAKIDYLKRAIPDMAFSTDIIVGFPGETESDFEESLRLLREVEFDQVYAFAYSPRPGTEAPRLQGALSESTKQERLQRLLHLQESVQLRRNEALAGRSFEVLVDGRGRLDNGLVKGRTRCNRIVHFTGSAARGDFADVTITHGFAHSLL